MKLSPIPAAAALSLVVVVVAYWTFGLVSGSDGDSAEAPDGRSATGIMLECTGGGEVQSIYAQLGDSFSMTGLLASKEPSGLLVRGPTGYIRMTVDSSVIDGPMVSGEPVRVTGIYDDQGNASATYVQPACESAYVVAAPTAAPQPAPTVAPSPTPAPKDSGDGDSGPGNGRGKDKRGRN